MKTREQIYGQEAAGILRDVSMYRALTEMQLLKLYPHKESKIRNLLSYLQKQGRIVQRGEYYRIPAEVEESIDHGLSKAVWVLTDFMEQVEYHSVSDYPAKIIFFADGEVYPRLMVSGRERMWNNNENRTYHSADGAGASASEQGQAGLPGEHRKPVPLSHLGRAAAPCHGEWAG